MYKWHIVISILIILCLHANTYTQPKDPILRIETGMHTVSGERISTDADGKYLLSCSDDKTARLWDAETGTLLNIFRVPIGRTIEGEIYACALSPDGTIAALGGRTGYEWENRYCIYLLKTKTGEIFRRIKGLPKAIYDLEFSPGGQWLAAGLGGGNGVRIYDTRDWNEYKKLTGFNGNINNIAFNRAGMGLAIVSNDRKIKLYDGGFNPTAEISNLAGKNPFSLAFNPAGNLLAVGYKDVSRIEVRNAADLSLLYEPSVKEAENQKGGLDILCFSADGEGLYGGGAFSKRDAANNWKNVIRYWSNSGKGSYTDILLMEKTVLDIKALYNGSMSVIGFYPDLAVINASRGISWYHSAPNNDYTLKDQTQFRISESGSAIGFKPINQPVYSFDVKTRKLVQEESSYPSPINAGKGTSITDLSVSKPLINGKRTDFLKEYEICHSADISSNGTQVILGTDENLYLADKNAKKIWSAPLPANASTVNISGNDKIVAVALGDGTIRWYSMADGKEMLAFYMNTDKKRWVLFTPSGYYDASPGAEDFLGWHINKGPDRSPSFYPVSRFKEQFYRPDIIDAIFDTYNTAQAITLANSHSSKDIVAKTEIKDIKEKLPPIITITNPANGSTVTTSTVTIKYSLKTPGNAPVKNIKVLVNGRPVPIKPRRRGVQVSLADSNTISVSIPRDTSCTITLLAENEYGVSPEANLYLKYKAPQTDALIIKPKLYVLAIGISDYENADLKLKYAEADANSMVLALQQQKGGLYGDVIVKKLIDKNATRENIQDGLQWIQDQTTQRDIAMIFYAGHGIDDNNGIFYIVPVGGEPTRLRSTCLNYQDLKQTVKSISGKVVVFIDACHSGNVMGGRRGILDINALVNELASTENGAVTFTSSTRKEYSLEKSEWEHGAFTKALLEGFGGKAAIPGKNKITVNSLDVYVSERVKELTNGKQHSTSIRPPNVPDFSIGIYPVE
jgi:WD40 repeat protein